MKRLFLYTIALIVCVLSAEAQTSGQNTQANSENNRWDLNKYVWSHTNYKTAKSDKPALDYDAIDNWMGIGPDYVLSISRDGKYFTYGVSKGTNRPLMQAVTIKSTTSDWQQKIGIAPGFFSADSKQYIFQDKDELCFLKLGTNQIQRVKDVYYFGRQFKGKGEWLAYQLKAEGTVVLQNLNTGKEKRFTGASGFQFENSNTWFTFKLNSEELILYNLSTSKELKLPPVTGYGFNSNGKTMVLQTTEKVTDKTITALHYISLPDGVKKTIWESADTTVGIHGYMPDDEGRQVVFTTREKKGGEDELSVWYWKEGMDKAEMKVNNQTPGIGNRLMIAASESVPSGAVFFGKYIMFMLQPRPEVLPGKMNNPIQVDIWSHKDTVLLSAQPALLQQAAQYPKTYLAVFNIEKGEVVRVENEGDQQAQMFPKGDFSIAVKSVKDLLGDRFWEAGYLKDSVWLVSLKDGSRRLLPISKWTRNVWFSPDGNYLVYFDADKECNYFSYDLRSGKIVNISNGVPDWQLGSPVSYIGAKNNPTYACGIAAWIEEDKGLFVYDAFDIWQLDLSGKNPAVNVTNGYGREHNTSFSLMNNLRGYGNADIIGEKSTLLLRAFNHQTKYNGFYQKQLGNKGIPELLYMGPCFFQNLTSDGLDEGMQPIKAEDSKTWIVKKQTATEAPNYFVTNDFKTYRALTDNQPQKAYNWLTTESINFKQLDGTMSQGVLYKPENFDPSKKYPVIVSFYTHVSDRPYQYPTPNYQVCPLLINSPAWMVSHGYLVFLPDIHFIQGQWGPSVVNTVDGAANYLKTLPYVDGERLGATGHSNSGRFGFYLLSHSTSFAAMCVGEGTTNFISAGLGIGLLSEGEGMLEWAEQTAQGSGLGMLWKNKETWLDHSSVLNADKVSSALLLFDNKDGLQRDQAAQLFSALRRLDKKAWWVHYDHGGHGLVYPLYMKDFTLRFTQYFDHFLKGAPAPRWMTQGVPFRSKGVELKYELDPDGSCGEDCKVCNGDK